MKILKNLFILSLMLVLSLGAQASRKNKDKKAEDIYSFASKIEVFDKAAAKALRAEMKSLTRIERERLMDMVMSDVEKIKSGQSVKGDDMIVYYVLAVLIPPVAVGLYTDWESKPTLINLVLTFIGWLPGVVHAFITISG
jgi:uncharacterized membrane protein YqaE (UPF0057 family)